MSPIRIKAVFNWSGGKDSALALYKILQDDTYEIVSLVTTLNQKNKRSSMHGIPEGLLRKQAECIGLPLHTVFLDPERGMEDYGKTMREMVQHFKDQGIVHQAFGDIHLNEVKEYREKHLNPLGIMVVEPLWNKTSKDVMAEFLDSGLRTIVVTTNADALDASFVGREIDNQFCRDLPEGVDICGENGEYHTFCFDGGMFKTPVPFAMSETFKLTLPFKMDTGEMKEFSYWVADLQEKG